MHNYKMSWAAKKEKEKNNDQYALSFLSVHKNAKARTK